MESLIKDRAIDSADQQERDFQRIERALLYLAENYTQQPSLAQLARQVNLSDFHFQRLFSRWAGVTPKQFLQYLTLEQAKQSLQRGESVLSSALDHGLQAPSRLTELFVRVEALSPGEFRRRGKDLTITYGWQRSAFGDCLVASSKRGITGLTFVVGGNREAALTEMQQRLPLADYRHDASVGAGLLSSIAEPGAGTEPVTLHLAGTGFQLQVWQALLRIPVGATASYRQLATALDRPGAARAVGTAVGRNPVAMLIPCHRVIRDNGLLGGYHWGNGRKLALLGSEFQRLAHKSSR